jgi:hypothetical protein
VISQGFSDERNVISLGKTWWFTKQKWWLCFFRRFNYEKCWKKRDMVHLPGEHGVLKGFSSETWDIIEIWCWSIGIKPTHELHIRIYSRRSCPKSQKPSWLS